MRLMLIIHPEDFKKLGPRFLEAARLEDLTVSEYHLGPVCPPEELPPKGTAYFVDLDSIRFGGASR